MGRRGGGGGAKKQNDKEQPVMIDLSSKDQPEDPNPSSKRTKVGPEVTKEVTNLTTLGNKILGNMKSPRRSQRIQHNVTSSSQVRDIEAVIENIDDNENMEVEKAVEEEEDQMVDNRLYEENTEEILSTRTMEEKVDQIIVLLEEQGKIMEGFFSKVAGKDVPSKNQCTNDARMEINNKYKDMYIQSQKKIEKLQEGNTELKTKLEVALAKLDGYEKGQTVLSGAIEKLKDAFLISSLTKATGAALGLPSSQAAVASPTQPTKGNPRVSKRKKAEKDNTETRNT